MGGGRGFPELEVQNVFDNFSPGPKLSSLHSIKFLSYYLLERWFSARILCEPLGGPGEHVGVPGDPAGEEVGVPGGPAGEEAGVPPRGFHPARLRVQSSPDQSQGQ